MLPIIWATLPTIVGVGQEYHVHFLKKMIYTIAAFLIGFNETNQKGVLLFGAVYRDGIQFRVDVPPRNVSNRNFWEYFICHLRVQCQQHERVHEEGQLKCFFYITSVVEPKSCQLTINALTLTFFSVGNVIGTEIFQPSDAPAYIPGKAAIMVLLTIQMGVAYLLRYINIRLNRKKLKALAELKAANGWTEEMLQQEAERHAFADLTDKQYVIVQATITAALKNKRNTFFIYTI